MFLRRGTSAFRVEVLLARPAVQVHPLIAFAENRLEIGDAILLPRLPCGLRFFLLFLRKSEEAAPVDRSPPFEAKVPEPEPRLRRCAPTIASEVKLHEGDGGESALQRKWSSFQIDEQGRSRRSPLAQNCGMSESLPFKRDENSWRLFFSVAMWLIFSRLAGMPLVELVNWEGTGGAKSQLFLAGMKFLSRNSISSEPKGGRDFVALKGLGNLLKMNLV